MKHVFRIAGLLVFAQTALAIPNPAAMYCTRTGGTYETRTTTGGGQAGVCKFNQNGLASECGDWAYFRHECQPNQCAAWSVDANSCETPIPLQ